MNLRYSLIFALQVILLLSCNAPDHRPINKFSDPLILKIADFQDRRLADSLYPFFGHVNPTYRREAAQAFASIQETGEVDRLGKLLLMDRDGEVRRAAAFALGQLQEPSVERLLLAALVKEKIPENTNVILEAYGKVTSHWKLEPDPFLDDSVTSAGLAWSLYRAGLRGKTDSTANGIAKRLLANTFADPIRIGAAHYFARGGKNFNDAEKSLIEAATSDDSPAVRMAAALALGKIITDTSLSTLQSIIADEKDSRVVINAVRALRPFPFSDTQPILYECLHHDDIHVGIAASELIRDLASRGSWISISSQAELVQNWPIKANLLEGALAASQNKDLALEVQRHYKAQKDPFVRAALLSSLKNYPAAVSFVRTELETADTAVVRSAAAAALVGMNYSKSFKSQEKTRFASMYLNIISSQEDPAVIGTIAAALADSLLGYKKLIRDINVLVEARNKLRLPEHFEALEPLESAIAYLRGEKMPRIRNHFNHPIDWDYVKSIPDDLTVTIKTDRGSMKVRLFVEDAPGSVANFLRLAEKDYFDGKPFHRVVPNFVIQAGCNRGDGWGSENYSIRSEFSSRRYGTGAVGMASAGKDTEGTQWFITLSPTPHLDGRYSLFGEVVDGMKVVDYVQVGDRIIDVDTGNFNAR